MGMENLMVVAFERVFGFCHQQEKKHFLDKQTYKKYILKQTIIDKSI